MRRLPLLLGLLPALLLSGCALFAGSPPRPAAVAPATEGPPLALVGEYEGMRLEGYMDRDCMVGHGNIALRSIGAASTDLAVNLPSLPNAAAQGAQPYPGGAARSEQQAEPAFPPALTLEAYQQRAASGAGPEAQAHAPGDGTGQAAEEQGEDHSRAPRLASSGGLVLGAYETAEPSPPRRPPVPAPAAVKAAASPSLPLGLDGAFVCRAKVDHPPTEKGRIRGVLHCTGERKMLVTLRNIGPDQGVGIGKESENGDLMILFYHAALDEAWRRFPAVKADILAARERQ
jgi:hypothetical protein